MAKRHTHGVDLPSRIRRMQEIIMSHSGVDEFHEILRLIIVKFFAEQAGLAGLPSLEASNALLATNANSIQDILDGDLTLQTPPLIFPEVQRIIGEASICRQDFAAIDQVFEELTSRSYKSEKGQYFTPRHVVDMCIEAIDPQPGESVCDPACGSAAFLKSAHSYGLRTYGSAADLYGFDYSHRACQVARAIALLGAAGQISIAQIDSLRLRSRSLLAEAGPSIEDHMGPTFKGFDVIVTNPPFAGDIGAEAFVGDYEVASIFGRKLERDVLFVERCIRLLRVGGRLAIVLPDNKVSGKGFRNLRMWIARHSEIKSVVSLHRYTFLPYTGQKAAVIFAVKKQPSIDPYDSIITFYRSDKSGKSSNGSFIFKGDADVGARPYEALDHDLGDVAADIRKSLCAA